MRFSSLLVPKALFFFVGERPFRLKNCVQGFRGIVPVGSNHKVGNPSLPPTLGYLRIRTVKWTFTPLVQGVLINGRAPSVDKAHQLRHLSQIKWGDTTMRLQVLDQREQNALSESSFRTV